MNEYQIKRKEFLRLNGFFDTPIIRLEYDKCKQDSLSDKDIKEKLIKRGIK